MVIGWVSTSGCVRATALDACQHGFVPIVVRDAVGESVDIAVDIHARYFEVQRAVRVAKEIEPYLPFWLEEPIRPENPDAMKKLACRAKISCGSGNSKNLA